MSKICVKCGNVIPDGMDVCPNCGREEYDDSNLQNVLSELGLSMDKDAKTETKETDSTEDEPTIRMPALDGETDDTPVKEDVDAEPEDSIEAILEEAVKEQAKRPAAPKKQPPCKRPENTNARKMAESGKKHPVSRPQPVEEEPQKNSAAIIGVVIGLLIALLVIGCGVAFMLFRMGFFTRMSDDELLNTPVAEASVTEPAAEPEQTAEPTQVPAVSSELETESSGLESSAVDDDVAAPPAEEEENIQCDKFTITGTEYIILYSRGVTENISFVIEPSDLRDKIKWESSDETIATVDSQGTIRARRGGTCTITGTCGDKSIKAYVTNEFSVPETTLDMNMEDITMTYEGQTAELAIDYELTDEQIKATVWESSDEEVAMVDKNGVVTAIANGTAVITASIGDYTASCIVRCVDVTGNRGYNNSDSEYVINGDDITLTRKGEYFQLTLKSVVGKDVPEYTWESDDPDVATVDSKGVVTAVSDGTAYITTSIGQDKFRCIVRVHISN